MILQVVGGSQDVAAAERFTSYVTLVSDPLHEHRLHVREEGVEMIELVDSSFLASQPVSVQKTFPLEQRPKMSWLYSQGIKVSSHEKPVTTCQEDQFPLEKTQIGSQDFTTLFANRYGFFADQPVRVKSTFTLEQIRKRYCRFYKLLFELLKYRFQRNDLKLSVGRRYLRGVFFPTNYSSSVSKIHRWPHRTRHRIRKAAAGVLITRQFVPFTFQLPVFFHYMKHTTHKSGILT